MGTVAVLGASRDRRKFGNKSLRAHRHAGWSVVPVNPNAEEVEGVRAIASLDELDGPVDRVTVYLPPQQTLSSLPEIVRASPREVWLNPGSADRRVVEEATRLGLPIVEGCSIVDLGLSPAQF